MQSHYGPPKNMPIVQSQVLAKSTNKQVLMAAGQVAKHLWV